MDPIDRFTRLINQILLNNQLPIIKWGQDAQHPEQLFSAQFTTSKKDFSEQKIKAMAACINTELRSMGLTADFPFILRPSTRFKNTTRLGFDTTACKQIITDFFAELDKVQFDLKPELYSHPTDPTRVILKANYGIRRPVSKIEEPKSVTFILDRSGSMGGQKLTDLKAFTQRIIDSLAVNDQYNIVTFNSRSELIVRDATKGQSTDEFLKFEAEADTDLVSPFRLMEQEKLQDPLRRNIAIFVTDGAHTETELNNTQVLEAIKALLPADMVLITLGVGADYDFGMIKGLSNLVNMTMPIHIRENRGYEDAERMVAQLSAVQSLPVKLQLGTQDRKVNLETLGRLKIGCPFTTIKELARSDLNDAELILIDSEKRWKKAKLTEAVNDALPTEIMIDWLIAKIHEAIGEAMLVEDRKVKLEFIHTMLETKLELDEEDPLYDKVENLKWLLDEARRGVQSNDKEALMYVTFMSNQTQQDYSRPAQAQPLTFSQASQPKRTPDPIEPVVLPETSQKSSAYSLPSQKLIV